MPRLTITGRDGSEKTIDGRSGWSVLETIRNAGTGGLADAGAGREGREKAVAGRAGWSVMENIRSAGFDELLALCGGCCSCATCHVHVDPEWLPALPPMSVDAAGLLDTTDPRVESSRR